MAAKNLRQFEFKLGKLGVVLLIVGLAILIFAGFLLGVQVGRNIDTYPEMIARGIPGQILSSIGLSAPVIKPEVAAGGGGTEQKEAVAGEGQAGKVTGGENLAAVMTAPPVSPAVEAENQGAPAGPVKASESTGAALPAPIAASSVAPQGATPEAAEKQPASPDKEKKEKAAREEKKTKNPPEKSGKYAVQVVSFREKEKANSLSRKIRDLGYAPKVAMVDVSGKGQWYRVTVNGFATKQEAEKAAEELTRKIKGLSCVIKTK